MIRDIAICEITEIYAFAVERGMADWNGIQYLIYRIDAKNHRHFLLNTFVVTRNFFNPDYQDDAYGLQWHETVRAVVVAFLDHHKLDRLVICTGKDHSLLCL